MGKSGSGPEEREGGRRLGKYQIRKKSQRGVPLNVRNVASLLLLGCAGSFPTEGGLPSWEEGGDAGQRAERLPLRGGVGIRFHLQHPLMEMQMLHSRARPALVQKKEVPTLGPAPAPRNPEQGRAGQGRSQTES